MGEIKSVKVDNWGVFFLQKLQNFFNKTDYCDLTLQFRDNSQLKVHRLVLSACTDYFNVLEQTCEVVDDAIIMPNGLQADVVVPIVNFMYTGTLEFELKMYNRLLRTAKDMNMTVLLKLLEAHRRTMEMHPQKNQAPTSPKARRKVAPAVGGISGSSSGRSLIQPQNNKRIVVSGNTLQQQHRIAPSNAFTRLTSSTAVGTMPVKQQIGSTTFTRIKQESDQDGNVGGGGYTLLKKSPQQPAATTSPFEQLRKSYTNNNKRPAPTTFISPPAKKPNLEDVKEFAEQQRMRKQIAAEYGDDGDYDAGIMDDDTIHNDDDDDDMTSSQPQGIATSSSTSAVQTSSPQQSEDPPGTTTIIVKHEGPDKPPTIVVKDSSNSKMNHAKIISEVLRQYPHLVNSNKNIKLKIMPNTGGQTQKVIVKKEAAEIEKPTQTAVSSSMPTPKLPTLPKIEAKENVVSTASVNTEKLKQSAGQTISVGGASNKVPSTTPTGATVAPSQKRRIDSKTMHALIALGAENTTGPWLCLRCGRNGHPISIPSYRGFRRHLINTHKEVIDPALCEHCGWRSSTKRELHFHMQLEHKIRTNLYIFPDCQLCQQICIDSDALNQHLIDSHPDENKQQCIYCNKIFPEELQLYTHMKTFHKKQALEDGIIDYSDDENTNVEPIFPPPEEEEMIIGEEQEDHPQQSEKKIKILSDISLPLTSSIIKTDSFVTENTTAGESTTSVASEEYLQEQDHVETKFVAADGSEVILTDEQRKEILSQLNQENEGSGVVMVLNENQQFAGGETQSEQGAISHDESSQATTATNEEQENDDNQIYNELKSETPGPIEEDTASQSVPDIGDNEQQDDHHSSKLHHEHLDESKESIDNLEWAENLISEHEMADEAPQTPAGASGNEHNNEEEQPKDDKSQDDIAKKLKELAGEWSEDEEVDEEMPEEVAEQKQDEKIENIDTEKDPSHDLTSIEKESTIDEVDKTESNLIGQQVAEEGEPSQLQEKQQQQEKEIIEDAEKKSVLEDDVDLALKSLHKEDDLDTADIHDAPEIVPESKETEHKQEDKTELKKEDDENDNEAKTDVVQENPVDETLLSEKETENKNVTDVHTNEHEKSANKDSADENNDATSADVKEEIADSTTGNTGEKTNDEPAIEDEFLDITPEKVDACKEEATADDTATGKEPTPSSTITVKDPEDRVKSLINEWGDDDDEEDNENTDTDLRADLYEH